MCSANHVFLWKPVVTNNNERFKNSWNMKFRLTLGSTSKVTLPVVQVVVAEERSQIPLAYYIKSPKILLVMAACKIWSAIMEFTTILHEIFATRLFREFRDLQKIAKLRGETLNTKKRQMVAMDDL